MTSKHPIRTTLAAASTLAALLLGAAACSSGSSASGATSTSSTPAAAESTSAAAPASSSVSAGSTPAASASAAASIPAAPADAPTIVLVHGAFADSSSWDGEITLLQAAGYHTIAFANPLRGLANDSSELSGLVETIKGPVVLVGHSYAGLVISQVAAKDTSVVGLVYVAAFIPEVGDSANSLISKYPGSELVPTNLNTAPAPGGLTDVYINQSAYGTVYAGGVDPAGIATAAATQRPITAEALGQAATAAAPAATPKWEIVATEDHAVPTALQQFMAQRAGATVVEVKSGHDVPAAQPLAVSQVIAEAAS